MQTLLQDFRFSVRQLQKSLGFTRTAVISLASASEPLLRFSAWSGKRRRSPCLFRPRTPRSKRRSHDGPPLRINDAGGAVAVPKFPEFFGRAGNRNLQSSSREAAKEYSPRRKPWVTSGVRTGDIVDKADRAHG